MATPLLSTSATPPVVPRSVDYPESDGRPLAETEVHIQCLIDAREGLRAYFREERDVHVGGDLLLYYEEGDPHQSVAPDVFMVRGLARDEQLRVYKLWEVGKPPDFVLEITSRGTRFEDTGAKRGLYQALGVPEYVLFDPLSEYLRPPLQGLRLVGDEYQPIPSRPDGRLVSQSLGLELQVVEGKLRFRDPRTDAWLRTPEEEVLARQEAERRVAGAEARVAAEAEARRAAEARAARAEAELAQLRTRLKQDAR
jgi:Uma2 family endonuclease